MGDVRDEERTENLPPRSHRLPSREDEIGLDLIVSG
jgi:hypothetical protein